MEMAFSYWLRGIDFRRLPFCLFLALERAWSRGLPISAKGWRVERAMSQVAYGARV